MNFQNLVTFETGFDCSGVGLDWGTLWFWMPDPHIDAVFEIIRVMYVREIQNSVRNYRNCREILTPFL